MDIASDGEENRESRAFIYPMSVSLPCDEFSTHGMQYSNSNDKTEVWEIRRFTLTS